MIWTIKAQICGCQRSIDEGAMMGGFLPRMLIAAKMPTGRTDARYGDDTDLLEFLNQASEASCQERLFERRQAAGSALEKLLRIPQPLRYSSPLASDEKSYLSAIPSEPAPLHQPLLDQAAHRFTERRSRKAKLACQRSNGAGSTHLQATQHLCLGWGKALRNTLLPGLLPKNHREPCQYSCDCPAPLGSDFRRTLPHGCRN
jgi:hypothetical protein